MVGGAIIIVSYVHGGVVFADIWAVSWRRLAVLGARRVLIVGEVRFAVDAKLHNE